MQAFIDNGFTLEYPDYWAKDFGNVRVTIANGESINGYMWEVQVMEDDACILATEGFDSPQDALNMVQREFN